MKILPGTPDFFMSPVTGKFFIPPGQLLLGDDKGHSTPAQTITLSNLPDLDRGYIWIGNRNSRPVPTLKLIDLTSDVRRLQAEVDQMSFVLSQVSIEPDTFNANRRRLEGVDDPLNPDDAATKGWVDRHTWLSSQITDLSSVPLSFWSPPVKEINMNWKQINFLQNPDSEYDAANLGTVYHVSYQPFLDIFISDTPTPSPDVQVKKLSYVYPYNFDWCRLPLWRLEKFPHDSSLFVRGDGSWSDPLNITTDEKIKWFCINTTNSEAQATGFMVKSDGQYAAEFGFNHKEQKGYVWTNGNYPLKFGTNGQPKMELRTDGTLDLQQNFITNAILDQLWSDGSNGKLMCRTFGSQPSIQLHVPSSLLKPISYALGSVIGFSSTNLHFYGNQNPTFMSPTIAEFHSSNQTVATVSSDGEWNQLSNSSFRHSIRKKDVQDKDYLDRLLKLNVYSYCTKNESPHLHNKISVGVMHDEVKELFRHCVSKKKTREGFVCQDPDCLECKNETKGIIPSVLSYYHILAFQDFYHSHYEPLVKRLEELEKTVQGIS